MEPGDTPVLVHNCGAEQVEFGGDHLSRKAIEARKANNGSPRSGWNVPRA
ncbi:hypothetical protein [Actinacidiphila rubida]|nr:hypothetical protein [Actinacidiphila rubida]